MPDDVVALIDLIGRKLGRLVTRWRDKGSRTPDDPSRARPAPGNSSCFSGKEL